MKVSRFSYITVLISLALALAFALPVVSSYLFDDAYIHARLVENFFDFGYFSFNEGDIFKAGSSTGYLLLVTLVGIFFDPVVSIRIVQFFTITFFVLCLIYTSFRLFGGASKVLVFAVLPFFLVSSYGGMETGIACGLFFFSILSAWKGSLALALLLAAASILFRVEFALYFILLWTYVILNFRLRAAYFYSVIPLFFLVLVDYYLYSSIMPHAAGVKSIAYGHPLVNSIINALTLGGGVKGILVSVLACLFIVLSLLSVVFSRFKVKLYHVCMIFSLGVLFAWAIGRSNLFPWYFPIFSTPFVLGVCLYIEDEGRNKYMAILGGVVAAGLALLGSERLYANVANEGGSSLRVKNYLLIGEGLYRHCSECTLMTSEIGGLGYGFKGVVYDAFGLGDPEAVKFHPLAVPDERQAYGIGAIPAAYAAYRDPDFIVSMPVFTYQLRNSVFLDSYYAATCYFKNDRSIFGDRYIEVYSKDLLPNDILSIMGCNSMR